MSAAQMLPAPGPDENHLTCLPDFSPASYPNFPCEKTATYHHALSQEKVCAMAKLHAKMQAMNLRMARAYRLKAHAFDLAAYHTEMRAIQRDLIRAEIELQADLVAEGFHFHGYGHHHHHHKRAFADETNHPDEVNHIVHDDMHDAEHFLHHLHADPHMFEDMELPSLAHPSPTTYRHSANGVQKMALARSESAQLRENHDHDFHGGMHDVTRSTQTNHSAVKHHPMHHSAVHVTTTSMMPPGASNSPPCQPAVATELKAILGTHVPSAAHRATYADVNIQVDSPDEPDPKKRRTVKRNPTRPSHTPWTTEESEAFKKLVADEGPSKWESKAAKLGTGRTAKALHTRWMRDQGRIIDRPRLTSKKSKTEPTLGPDGTTAVVPPAPPPPPSVPVPSAPPVVVARAPAPAPAAAPAPAPLTATAQQQAPKPLHWEQVAPITPEMAEGTTEVKSEVATEVKSDPPKVA